MHLKVLSVETKIDDVTYENNLQDDLKIDQTQLDREFVEQSEKYAYYATLAELAKDREARLESELKVLSARIDWEIRDQAAALQASNTKVKLTEEMVKNQVIADSRIQTKNKELLEARKLAGMLRVAKESFLQRKDMLVSLGANHRVLNGNDAHVSRQQVQMEHAKTVLNRRKPMNGDGA